MTIFTAIQCHGNLMTSVVGGFNPTDMGLLDSLPNAGLSHIHILEIPSVPRYITEAVGL
jgi:hypothetical protein